jgi:lactoylglutathione lyase
MRVSYAIVFVSDMSRSVSFYRDLIGLPLRFESPGWSEFATDGATFALHAGGAPHADVSDSTTNSAGTCRPGLAVPNLEEFHQTMIAKGVRCCQPPKQTFGAWIAQYVDPDGLVISVSEARKDN